MDLYKWNVLELSPYVNFRRGYCCSDVVSKQHCLNLHINSSIIDESRQVLI